MKLRFLAVLTGVFLVTTAAARAYVPINATYHGLFYETNQFWDQSAGSITISTTSRGYYSAKIQLGWYRYGFSGTLSEDGSAVKQLVRFFEPTLTVRFEVDENDPDLIVGSVSSDDWRAELIADRAVFDGRTNLSPDAGQYTMVILGVVDSTETPAGTSSGTITVDKAGRLRFAGSLADGTKVSQSSWVSQYGQWPLYVPLYRGYGALYGWLVFNAFPDEDISGEVTWVKPEMPWSWYYPDGFAVLRTASGSRYTRPPKGTKVLDIAQGIMEFNGGNLDHGFTNQVTLDANNRIYNHSSNGLKVSISLSSGAMSGSVQEPGTFHWMPFHGVVLQKQNVATGAFLDWDRSGEVWLQAK